jgi:hypothetical protein
MQALLGLLSETIIASDSVSVKPGTAHLISREFCGSHWITMLVRGGGE